MRILNFLIRVLILLGLLAAGLLLLGHVFKCPMAGIDGLIFGNRVGQLLVGLSAVFLVLLYWATALPDRGPRYLYLQSEGGAVQINLSAINDYLSKLDSEFAGIVRLRPDVQVSKRGLVDVRLDLHVRERTKVQELSQVLQQRVREAMREDLGITEVRHVRVNVEKFLPEEQTEFERPEWHDMSGLGGPQ